MPNSLFPNTVSRPSIQECQDVAAAHTHMHKHCSAYFEAVVLIGWCPQSISGKTSPQTIRIQPPPPATENTYLLSSPKCKLPPESFGSNALCYAAKPVHASDRLCNHHDLLLFSGATQKDRKQGSPAELFVELDFSLRQKEPSIH